MAKITADIPPDQIKRAFFLLDPDKLNQATRAASNKTMVAGRTILTRHIAGELNLQQKTIRERIKVRKARTAAESASLIVGRKPVPLIDYKASQTKLRGVRVRVRKGAGAEVHPHWFIATMKTGHVGVFDRKKLGGKRVARAIKEKFGPTPIGTLAGKPGFKDQFKEQLTQRHLKELAGQINRFTAVKEPDETDPGE